MISSHLVVGVAEAELEDLRAGFRECWVAWEGKGLSYWEGSRWGRHSPVKRHVPIAPPMPLAWHKLLRCPPLHVV